MGGIIDRFEGAYAIVEIPEGKLYVPVNELPSEAVEGMAIFFQDGRWLVDYDETARRHAYVKSLMDELFE